MKLLRGAGAVILGTISFFLVIFVVNILLLLIVSLLLQIEIVEILVRWLITLPVSRGWGIDEGTALMAVLGGLSFVLAYYASGFIIDKIGGTYAYIPFKIVGALLLVNYVSSGIMDLIAGEAIWGAIYGIVCGINFLSKP